MYADLPLPFNDAIIIYNQINSYLQRCTDDSSGGYSSTCSTTGVARRGGGGRGGGGCAGGGIVDAGDSCLPKLPGKADNRSSRAATGAHAANSSSCASDHGVRNRGSRGRSYLKKTLIVVFSGGTLHQIGISRQEFKEILAVQDSPNALYVHVPIPMPAVCPLPLPLDPYRSFSSLSRSLVSPLARVASILARPLSSVAPITTTAPIALSHLSRALSSLPRFLPRSLALPFSEAVIQSVWFRFVL